MHIIHKKRKKGSGKKKKITTTAFFLKYSFQTILLQHASTSAQIGGILTAPYKGVRRETGSEGPAENYQVAIDGSDPVDESVGQR